MQLSQWIKAEAARLGFPLTGITSLAPPEHWDFFQAWIAAGRHASMAYLADSIGLQKRADPRLVFPPANTVISLAMPYAPSQNLAVNHDQIVGQVASYAWGTDYHDVIPARLVELSNRIADHLKCQVAQRVYTDTGPILERDLAQRAGLGWAGKNSCLIDPNSGSYYFLAELFLDIELDPDESFKADHCGSCRRCIEACPTACIREDRTLDAARCISYQTIENKGLIPAELRPQLGNWVFGCDICQQVCPWNRFAEKNQIDPAFQPRQNMSAPLLLDEIQMDARQFNHKFRLSPVRRAKRRGYLRNVCIALGNSRQPAALPALKTILEAEPEPLIRGAAAWAIDRIDPTTSRPSLEKAFASDPDPMVHQEIKAILTRE